MNIRLNKEKSIGKVLYIVEGGKTEPYLLHRIFCKIMNYQLETILRDKGYRKYNSQENATSQVFVINAEESNIQYIDRDNQSNKDTEFIRNLLSVLVNSRDNVYTRQGMLLLSYPSIEAFTFSNFVTNSFEQGFKTGDALKKHLNECKINQSRINENTVKHATEELLSALEELQIEELDVDAFGESNLKIFEQEEVQYEKNNLYIALSLLCVSLIDLGILEIEA